MGTLECVTLVKRHFADEDMLWDYGLNAAFAKMNVEVENKPALRDVLETGRNDGTVVCTYTQVGGNRTDITVASVCKRFFELH